MITLFAKRWIPNYQDTKDPQVRRSYGVLCGAVGIFLNTILCAAKLFAGILTGSIAITADAFNNLSDAGSSVITLFGFKLAGQKPDPEHPFGHGRGEYIASLIVSFIIMMVGLELLKSSLMKILHPEEVSFNIYLLLILILSILVKVWMFSYNRYIGKRIDSAVMRAAAFDSLNDVIDVYKRQSLAFALHKWRNIPKNMIYQVVILSLLAVVWDRFTGWHGWSLDYVIPILCVTAMVSMSAIAKVCLLYTSDL